MIKKRGVLLVNLGTPQSFQPKDVYHYLNEFLTDARVIDFPWLKRQLLVRGLIVPFRYKQSAKQYENVWTKEGSPLLIHGKNVQAALQTALGDSFTVSLAMRYQHPSIKQVLEELREKNLHELTILPLFPQYASATTGSVYQKVMEELKNWTFFPQLKFINHFYDHPDFIEACCEKARQYPLKTYDHILFSFHGLPERQIKPCRNKSICYKGQCYRTAKAIAEKLNLRTQDFTICFQSRLGKEPWIQPYTSDILRACAKKDRKKLLVFSPSFVCDCLETIGEIAQEYAHEFKIAGGEELQLVEGLNSHPSWIKALKNIILHQ